MASSYRRIAKRRGLGVDDARLAVLAGVADELLDDCAVVDALPDVRLPVRYPRQDVGGRPVPAEDPLHGWVWRCRIEGAPTGPLSGLEVGLKDTIAVGGVPMLNGSEVLEGFVPSEDATIVTRLLDAGATIVGKTAVPAFCFESAGLIGYPEPLPLNPYDAERLPGGSSSGSAALVAAGEIPLAIGGDQGGSIRIPAAWCGCVGHKPTFGLVPYTGVFPVEYTLDSVGPMARRVADCAALLDAMAGPDGLDPRQPAATAVPTLPGLERGMEGLRVGVLDEGSGIPGVSEAAVDWAFLATVDRLRSAGAQVERASVPLHRSAAAVWSLVCTQGAVDLLAHGAIATSVGGYHWTELADFLHRALPVMAGRLPDTVKATVLAADRLTETRGMHYYAKARNRTLVLRDAYDEALRHHDVLVMPTTPMQAPRRRRDLSAEDTLLAAIGLHTSHNVAPFNLTGHPSLSVPCQPPGELPIGFLVVGRAWEDDVVLAVGRAVERAVQGS